MGVCQSKEVVVPTTSTSQEGAYRLKEDLGGNDANNPAAQTPDNNRLDPKKRFTNEKTSSNSQQENSLTVRSALIPAPPTFSFHPL